MSRNPHMRTVRTTFDQQARLQQEQDLFTDSDSVSEEDDETDEEEDNGEDEAVQVMGNGNVDGVEVVEVESQQVNSRCCGEEGEASSSSRGVGGSREGGTQQSSEGLTDEISCSICYQPWTSEGVHQVSCLPCGHLYGLSCIQKWIRQRGRNSKKCPQCSRVCTIVDVIKVYAPRVVAADREQEKKMMSLKAENEALKLKVANLNEKLLQNKKVKRKKEKEATYCLDDASFREMISRQSQSTFLMGTSHGHILNGYTVGSDFVNQGSACNFTLEDELVVDGARVFDMDASSQILILARRLSAMAGNHVLTKFSMIYPYESEIIHLPLNTNAIKDLCISPHSDRLALVASLGKKLSVVSMESNNIVLTYNLQVPAWSCSWDQYNPHCLYTGLQNGMLLVFDMRQTVHPVESLIGLTTHPVHTIHTLRNGNSQPSGSGTLLSASSVGPCIWTTGGTGERPVLVPEMENQGVCISLAYCPLTGDIVSSFRPRVEMSIVAAGSQHPLLTPTVPGQGVLGSHVHIKKTGYCYQRAVSTVANVHEVRMPKSAIINVENCNPVFAYEDEGANRLSLRQLPSLRVSQVLDPHRHPVLDVKYTPSDGRGLLGCLSENKLQLFSAKSL